MSIDITYFGRDVNHKWSNFFGIATVFRPAGIGSPTNVHGHCFGLHDFNGNFLVYDHHKCDQDGQQVSEFSHFSMV